MKKFSWMRQDMVETQIIARGIRDKNIIAAFLKVPRERFVAERSMDYAYEDNPVSICEGQTISQPYIVAYMTESLNLKGGEKVLEIGTGSGYQSAILAEMGCEVYSVERIPALAAFSEKTLKELGYKVRIKIADGTLGWDEFAPYDRIMVTAAGPKIPPSLCAQLKEGGLLIMPVGDKHFQKLIVARKIGGRIKKKDFGDCRFVLLRGVEGWDAE